MRQCRTGRILAESLQPNVEHMRPFAQDDNGRGLALRAGAFVVRKPGEEDATGAVRLPPGAGK